MRYLPLKKLFLLILGFIFFQWKCLAQSAPGDRLKSVRIGIEISGGGYFPKDLNALLDEWHERIVIIFDNRPAMRFSWGSNLFLAVRPLKYLELRADFSVFHGPPIYRSEDLSVTFQDGFTKDQLYLNVQAIVPRLSVNFLLDRYLIGVGISKAYAKIEWDDRINNYQNTWYGNDYGVNFLIGVNPWSSSWIGMSFLTVFRLLDISPVHDSQGRTAQLTREQRTFSLNLTGFELSTGLFIAF